MQDAGFAGVLQRDAQLRANVEYLVDVDPSPLTRVPVCHVPCGDVDRPIHGVDVAVDLRLVIMVLGRPPLRREPGAGRIAWWTWWSSL